MILFLALCLSHRLFVNPSFGEKVIPVICQKFGSCLFSQAQDEVWTYFLILQLPDQICNSPYCELYNSHDVSYENLVLDQLIIPKLIVFFILITCLVDNVLIM